MDSGGKCIVEVQPFVGCVRLAEKGVVLEGFLGIGGKAVCEGVSWF